MIMGLINGAGPDAQPEKVNWVLSLATVMFMAFALLNVAREATYMIGAIQYFGAPRQENYFGVGRALLSIALGGVASGLRKLSIQTWCGAVIGGAIFCWQLVGELIILMNRRALGQTNGDVQIVLLNFAIVILGAGVLLLLLPPGFLPFFSPLFKGED